MKNEQRKTMFYWFIFPRGEKMSFINKNVNMGLLILIIVLAIAIAAIGIYYNENYSELSSNYNTQLTNLKKVTDELVFHKSQLNQTTTVLKTKQEDESELNKRYNTLRDDNAGLESRNSQLDSDLKVKIAQLTAKTNELVDAQSTVTTQKNEIEKLESTNKILKVRVDNLEDRVDDVCAGQVNLCD